MIKAIGQKKINGGSVAKKMPFSANSEWVGEARRWTRMLYNPPISLAIDYSIINLKDSEARKDKEAIGYSKRKLKSKSDENEADIKNEGIYEHIDYECMSKVFKSRYKETVGSPIARIATQLNESGGIFFRELGVGVRNPEGAWGWI